MLTWGGLGGTTGVALGDAAVAICRAGLTFGGLGGTTGRTGSFGHRHICRAGLTCGGLDWILVTFGASAVTICRAVCHEGLEETGGRRMMSRKRSGFDIEV